jgi:hypothetical protein
MKEDILTKSTRNELERHKRELKTLYFMCKPYEWLQVKKELKELICDDL